MNAAVTVDYTEIYRNSLDENRSCKEVTISTFCNGLTNANKATMHPSINFTVMVSAFTFRKDKTNLQNLTLVSWKVTRAACPCRPEAPSP